jgi:hypothetical protein
MEPYSQAEPRLRTTLLYTNMTAQSVYDALVAEGWSEESLPTVVEWLFARQCNNGSESSRQLSLARDTCNRQALGYCI